jgi:hypothetical protein
MCSGTGCKRTIHALCIKRFNRDTQWTFKDKIYCPKHADRDVLRKANDALKKVKMDKSEKAKSDKTDKTIPIDSSRKKKAAAPRKKYRKRVKTDQLKSPNSSEKNVTSPRSSNVKSTQIDLAKSSKTPGKKISSPDKSKTLTSEKSNYNLYDEINDETNATSTEKLNPTSVVVTDTTLSSK